MMGQLIERWMGLRAELSRITASYRGLAMEGETLTARARVAAVERVGERATIRLDVWVEGDSNKKVAEGWAMVRVRGGG
jgi:hypothetical protein